MSLEILSIGNELLTGHTINSNAAVIAQALLPHGFSVDKVTILPDERVLLKKGIEEAKERSSFVITTGGLGPTGDDLTRDIIAEIFHAPLEKDEGVWKELVDRYGENWPTLEDQCLVPKGAEVIHNPLGTAPGFIIKNVIILPGVPFQMEVMLPAVINHLEKHHKKSHYVQPLYLSLLSEATVDPLLRALEKQHPGIEIGICPGYGTLSVYVRGEDPETIIPIRDRVANEFKPYVYSTEHKEIERALHLWMVENQKTFAAAESCTGGQLAERLTAHPGASDYFLGGIVSYSNRLKESALGVSSETLKRHGAVSRETALEMVEGIQKLTGVDYAVSTTGIAGPDGGTPEKPVGTVWSAIRTPQKTFVGQIPMKRSIKGRGRIIEYTTTYLFAALYRYLTHHIEPYHV